MSQTGESGGVAVRKWIESKDSKKLEGVKREAISSAIMDMIKCDMKLKEGADEFVETLQKMFYETTSSGNTMKVLGNLNEDTMITAIFHCVEAASDNDKINIAYVINILSTDLPREDTKLDIATVKDFAHEDLTKNLTERLTKESEVELQEMTQDWLKREPAEDIDGPSLTFKCKLEGDKLEVTILSCQDLPNFDYWSKTDAYVIVKVGSMKKKTKSVGGDLNPKFEEETSTFLFDNISELARQSRIRFQVMDKDSWSSDDLVGEASIKLSTVDKTGQPYMVGLGSPGDRDRVLTFSQTTAIYNLFSVLDSKNTGYIPPEIQNLVVDSATKEAVLLTELKAFIDEKKDIDGDGEVSFGEFLEAFRVHEDPGTTEHINELAEEFKLLKGA
jgi:hypothetical protein